MSHKTGQPSNSGAKQLRLWSEEEHEKLLGFFSVSPPTKGETPSCETDGDSKAACPPERVAVQDELPFP